MAQRPLKRLKAIFFDFDGVILDTETALFESWQKIADEYGCPFPLERWAANTGGYQYDVFDPLSHIESLSGRTLDREAVNAKRRTQYLEQVGTLQAMPGIRDALETTRGLNLPMAVVSSSSTDWVTGHLERLELSPYFEFTCCGDEVAAVKPSPELYHLALNRMNLSSGDVCVIEDSPKGIAAARAAGLYCIAVPNPVTRASALDACDRLLEGLDAIAFNELLFEIEETLARAF